ncbi:MAG TPA: hypothetical protein VNH18_22025 [Bryobacteraceae bacterium]|nr:hypothetical protein [Bryobacteraceae bacterium]
MRTFVLRLALIGIVSVRSLTAGQMSAVQGSSPCHAAAVPAQVSEALKNKFADWRPKQLSDMEPDDQQLWLKGPNGEACPGITTGHFESTRELSYAFLLVPKSEPTGGYKVVVFSRSLTGGAYVSKLLDHADGETYSGLVISKADPGKYSDFEGTKSIQTKLDGVYVEWMEKGAVLYYWSAGRYHRLQVSD